METLKGLYHADKLDEKSFVETFTIRIKEFHLIIDNLLQQGKKPLQHFLITGKRGMGKSTLLRRIHIEASRPPITEKLFAVRLGSEQYRLSRLFKLWEMAIEQLSLEEPILLEQKKNLEKSRQYEENIVFIIIDHLTKSGKTLLLLIDNFDQFIDKIPAKDQHALREILILYPIQIIGNTVFYNENFKSYNHPFYDFFKPIHLYNLDKEEANKFIKSRAIGEGIGNFEETYKFQNGKINTLRILSGGVPRTLLILLSIVSKKNTGSAVDYLHEMIEQVTPLYQDRMKALSAQQQEIMHILAMRWDKTPVKELAAEMRIPSKSISAQLAQLEKSGYAKKVDVPGRNHYYEIDERFFNIWLLMSEAAPYDTKRVIWLTKWLDAFYSNNELKGFAKFCQNGLKEIKPGNRFLIAQALSESEKLEHEHKKQLIDGILEDLKEEISEVKIWADNYNKKSTQEEINLTNEIHDLIDAQDYEGAKFKLKSLGKINMAAALTAKAYLHLSKGDIDKAEMHYQMAVEKNDTNALLHLGFLYETVKKDIISAEKYYLQAAEKNSTAALIILSRLYLSEKNDIESAENYLIIAVEKGNTEAMFKLGLLYQNQRRDIAGAEKYYMMAIEKKDTRAMTNLAYIYYTEKKDIASAEKYLLMATEKGNTMAMVNLGNIYLDERNDAISAEKYYIMGAGKGNIDAMFNLGILYGNDKKDISAAEKYYMMAIEEGHTKAMVNLGYIYKYEKKDLEGAEKYFTMAMLKGDTKGMLNLGILLKDHKKDIIGAEKYFLMALKEGDTDALFVLGNLYLEEKNDIVNAEEYYQMAIEKGNVDAMFNLGILYDTEKNDIDGAEKYYLMAVEKGDTKAMASLGYLYGSKKNISDAEKYLKMALEKGNSSVLLNLGNLSIDKKDISGAEKYYLMAVEEDDADAMGNLGILYQNEKKDIAAAEKYYLMAVEKGNTDAMFNLGFLYDNEKNDIASAEKYYLMAMENGDSDAMVNLGNLYNNIKKDRDKAEKYYMMAVEKGGDIDAMLNLGNLYMQDKDKSKVKAEKYYRMAVEKESPEAMSNLANFYFETNSSDQKAAALDLAHRAVQITEHSDINLLIIHVGILLWNERINEAKEIMIDILNGPLHTDDNMGLISEALQYLLVFKQKQFLHRTLSSNTEWIDRYKPIYYALLHEMKDEYLKEYLKMTSELEEPVREIREFVVNEQKRLNI